MPYDFDLAADLPELPRPSPWLCTFPSVFLCPLCTPSWFLLIGSPVALGPSWAWRDWTVSVVWPSVGRDADGVRTLADTEAEELAGGSFELALELATTF